ncbi:MAG: DNA polymerase III subunit beta [Flavobacteriales bacterium]
MKFLVSSSQLLRQLQIANTVINTASVLPILENFLFTLESNQLYITASDLETSVKIKLDVQSEDSGSVAIPAKLLMDVVKSFPDQPLTFMVNTTAHLIEIHSQQGQYELAYQDGDEFPQEPEIQSDNLILVSGNVLEKALNKSSFAAGNDDLRPVMSGVFCEFSPEETNFVATNGHKLVKYTRRDIKADDHCHFILPRKPITVLKSFLSNYSDDEIQLSFNKTNAKFELENIRLTCRFIEGKYPNYSAVIPLDNPYKLYVDRSALLSAVKRVAIFSNKSSHQIQFKLNNNSLALMAEDIDFSNKADEQMVCQFDGEFNIAFNSKFLIELLQNMDSEEILFEMSQPSRAGILSPHEAEPNQDEDILMLIMPITIN